MLTFTDSHYFFFQKSLLTWYNQNKRDLPWRTTQNPYFIWLSEVILQQTRVKQGLPYYQRFIEEFPTIQALAEAETEQVLRVWQGLGYYSRARNMHQTARIIWHEHHGQFPPTYAQLLTLKGIGPYTAAAIAAFAFHEPVAAVDGNVFRVLARIFGIDTDIQSTRARKEFTEIANLLLPESHAADFNQAMMEFGATQCVPQNPVCLFCPAQSICFAFQNQAQANFPVKEKKTKVRPRYFHYWIIQSPAKKIILKKRAEKDIWQDLYEFPLVELKEFSEEPHFPDWIQPDTTVQKGLTVTHLLSHQKLFITFWHIQTPDENPAHDWYTETEIEALPKPIVIEQAWKQFVRSF